MFERFTKSARDTVLRAQAEALAANDHRVGQSHLLLALLDTATVPDALRARGVDAAYVRARIAAPATPPKRRRFGRVPFSARARHTLELALREAVTHRHGCITAGHLLLAIQRDAGGPAWGILAGAGVDPEALRAEVLTEIQARRAA